MSLADLTSREAVLAAQCEFDAIGRDAFLEKYGFGPAREYFLELNGELYDSKAVVGAAHGFQFPDRGPLRSGDFSGGEATVEAKLTGMGFRVVRARRDDAGDAPATWSAEEVAATVSEYFQMLEYDLRGEPYNKKEHNRRLQRLLRKDLWARLAQEDPDLAMPMTPSLIAELDRRLAEHESDLTAVIPWEQLRAELVTTVTRWR